MTYTDLTNGTRTNASEVVNNFHVHEFIGDTMEQEIISVTATSGSASFTATSYGLVLRNKGANQCYVNFDAAATTSHRMLESGEEWYVYIDGGVDAVHAICDSGDTASLRVVGFR